MAQQNDLSQNTWYHRDLLVSYSVGIDYVLKSVDVK